MGKTTNNTKTEAPAKRVLKSKPAADKAPAAKAAADKAVAKPVIVEKAPEVAPASKPAAPKKAAKAAAKPAATGKKKPAFTQEDIALRAYYIAERRQAAGIHADPHHDWIEAERQLSYEAGTTVAPKAKAKAKA